MDTREYVENFQAYETKKMISGSWIIMHKNPQWSKQF